VGGDTPRAATCARARESAAFTAPTEMPMVAAISSSEWPSTSLSASALRCCGGSVTNTASACSTSAGSISRSSVESGSGTSATGST
jgi:hypothetical protein